MQLVYHVLFFGCQLVRVCRIDSRHQAIPHFIFLVVQSENLLLEVNVMQQQSVFHFEFRSSPDYLSLKLELDYTDSLMHLCYHSQCLVAVLCVIFLGIELCTRVVRIGFHGEGSEWQQIDAVSVFQCRQIAVSHGKA